MSEDSIQNTSFNAFRTSQAQPAEAIERAQQVFLNSKHNCPILENLPIASVILNKFRQIIWANKMFSQLGNMDVVELIAGLRPGIAFQCINTETGTKECGTTENCAGCGFLNSLYVSYSESTQNVSEVSLVIMKEFKETAIDFEITTQNYIIDNEVFLLVFLKDISDRKRREHYERMLNHSLINKVGSVKGLMDVMDLKIDQERRNQIWKIITRSTKELFEEIQFQNKLNQAETGDLSIITERIESSTLLNATTANLKGQADFSQVTVQITEESEDFDLITDVVILKRILFNLTKNAIEATERNGGVQIWAKKIDSTVLFSVHNSLVIPKEIQHQMFIRSFSTKGIGRGLGNYAVRFFTTQYLKGTVSFTSNLEYGTTFEITIPLDLRL